MNKMNNLKYEALKRFSGFKFNTELTLTLKKF